MPSDIEFRMLLLSLEDDMTNDERKKFVFLLGSDIPRRKRDESLVDIFDILIDRGRISDADCSYLMPMFETLHLFTAAYKVAQFEARHSLPVAVQENVQPAENVSLGDTTSSYTSSTPTAMEFVNEFYTDDAMLLLDSAQNSPMDTPVITESAPIVAALAVENTDVHEFASGSWSEEFLKKINVTCLRPYEYQRELVQSAIQAGNTIICLRAGGGKTFVAALLFKYYLMKKMTATTSSKLLAFFIVPRRAMLKQQAETLQQIGNLRVTICDERCNAADSVHTSDVIVCTPRKLLNCLQAKTILLSDVDLICFDECHDSVIRNQYIEIMQYLMCKNVDHIPRVSLSPVIIGLTAIGVHCVNPSQIMNSLANLCGTFNCEMITTVSKKENDEELERCVTRVSEDTIVCVEKKLEYESCKASVEKELKNLISYLFTSKDTNQRRIFPDKDLDMNGYEQNLKLIKGSHQKKQDFASVLLLDYTLIIFRHLCALRTLTPDMVLSDLKEHIDMVYKTREHPLKIDTLIYERCQSVLKKKLTEIEQSGRVTVDPKLEKLIELLKTHAENPNNRVLILVERTFYAKKICAFLQQHFGLQNTVKPCWFVGHNSTSSKEPNQNQTLEDFRAGVYNVMICTDVVQAGLNIPHCSLVLRYDFVPDSIGTVQARVRARAVGCKYSLITTKDSPNYDKERDGRQYERDFEQVLDTWRKASLDEFHQRVRKTQESLVAGWSDALIRLVTVQATSTKSTELTGEVLCRHCGFLLGRLADVRRYKNAYFLNDRSFYNRVEEKLSDKPQQFATSTVTGDAFCGNKTCRKKLGCIEDLHDYPQFSPIYPLKCETVKIKQIDKETGKENMIMKKKWSTMPFTVPFLLEPSSPGSDEDIFHDACDTFTKLTNHV